jgi:hypothetical protein
VGDSLKTQEAWTGNEDEVLWLPAGKSGQGSARPGTTIRRRGVGRSVRKRNVAMYATA